MVTKVLDRCRGLEVTFVADRKAYGIAGRWVLVALEVSPEPVLVICSGVLRWRRACPDYPDYIGRIPGRQAVRRDIPGRYSLM